MTKLQELFAEMDWFLTERQKPIGQYPATVDALLKDGMVYLSDGGYSRVYVTYTADDLIDLEIGSESRPIPIGYFKTSRCQQLIEKICTILNSQNMEPA